MQSGVISVFYRENGGVIRLVGGNEIHNCILEKETKITVINVCYEGSRVDRSDSEYTRLLNRIEFTILYQKVLFHKFSSSSQRSP